VLIVSSAGHPGGKMDVQPERVLGKRVGGRVDL
jgi:hypothetical protein